MRDGRWHAVQGVLDDLAARGAIPEVAQEVAVARHTLQYRAVHASIQQALGGNAVVEYDAFEGLFRVAATAHSSLGACRPLRPILLGLGLWLGFGRVLARV